ncbi:MAG: class I SAM-dependent rRNA methyltransferase [Verrucomicrobia bacterium]|nr:class I SAM-dependent rRNA methyltransferase [Verrucomicrobiota bacterium]
MTGHTPYPQLTLTGRKGVEAALGHPWVFSGNIVQHGAWDEAANGAIVDLVTRSGRFTARGMLNRQSEIAVRVLTLDQQERIDAAFVRGRIERALHSRQRTLDLDEHAAYRVVFGEADGLPGLVIDSYAGHVVVQFHTLGMDRLKALVLEAIDAVLAPHSIYERSDLSVREHEGLPADTTGPLSDTEPPDRIEIVENGLKYLVDVRYGQKTGLFLDQRLNHMAIRRYAKGTRALDCFCYAGAFGLNALAADAEHVTFVDSSERARDYARANVDANRVDNTKVEFVASHAKAYLQACADEGRTFGLIVLDPPGMAKIRRAVPKALAAHQQLHELALHALEPGGILASACCSAHIQPDDLLATLDLAARATGCDLALLETGGHPPDHPVLLRFPEGRYLSFAVCEKRG